MHDTRVRTILRQLQHVADRGQPARLSDGQLLERFAATRDQAAFEVLVWRHGPMVLRLCENVLRQAEDAEDAFQATFLTLVRKAPAITKHQSVRSWLYKVAYRIALQAQERRSKYPSRVANVAEPATLDGIEAVDQRDAAPVLYEEIARLPDHFRLPVILCYLDGQSTEEAARAMGCPKGTILSRLATAREKLRVRLTRRGVTLSAGALGVLVGTELARAEVPSSLVDATLRTAFSTSTSVGLVSANVLRLSQGALQAMWWTKVKTAVVMVLSLGVLGGGAGWYGYQAVAQQPDKAGETAAKRRVGYAPPGTGDDLVQKIGFPADGAGNPWTAVTLEGNANLWEAAVLFTGHTDAVTAVAIAPDGKRVATGSGDQSIRIWELESGQEVMGLRGHQGIVYSLGFSPDGKLLASGGGDQQVRLWDAATGKHLSSTHSFVSDAYWVVFSPDGKQLAVASGPMSNADAAGEVVLLEVPTGKVLSRLHGHATRVYHLAFSANGRLLFTASKDKTVKAWDVQQGKEVASIDVEGGVTGAAFSADGRLLALAGADKTIALFDVVRWKPLVRVPGHGEVVYSAAFSPDGSTLATGGNDGAVRVWDVRDGKLRFQFKGHDQAVHSMLFTPDGQRLATAGSDKLARLWSLRKTKTATKPEASGLTTKTPDRYATLLKQLIEMKKSDAEALDALFIATLARYPTETEKRFTTSHFQSGKPREEVLRDILFVLTSSKEAK